MRAILAPRLCVSLGDRNQLRLSAALDCSQRRGPQWAVSCTCECWVVMQRGLINLLRSDYAIKGHLYADSGEMVELLE